MSDRGFGRLAAVDDRDQLHQMRSLVMLPELPPNPWAYYFGGMWLDQGSKPQCVEYAWHHWLQLGKTRPIMKWPYWPLGSAYAEMQTVDEWEGTNYDGTSVRAGAKVLQRMGYIDSYLWAWDAETVIQAVLTTGPVVMGTNWYTGMSDTNSDGVAKATGWIEGGHAWVIDGVSRKTGRVRAKNSWNRTWGKNGRFYLSFDDLSKLIEEDGEACLAVEVRK